MLFRSVLEAVSVPPQVARLQREGIDDRGQEPVPELPAQVRLGLDAAEQPREVAHGRKDARVGRSDGRIRVDVLAEADVPPLGVLDARVALRDPLIPAVLGEIPGIRHTIGYVDLRVIDPDSLAVMILQKLGRRIER